VWVRQGAKWVNWLLGLGDCVVVLVWDGAWQGWLLELGGSGVSSGRVGKNQANSLVKVQVFAARSWREQIVVPSLATSELMLDT